MNDIKPKIGLAVIVSPYEVGAENAAKVLSQGVASLRSAGLNVSEAPTPIDNDDEGIRVGKEFANQELDAICVLYATYADDTFASSLLEQSSLPAILWATNDYDAGSIAGVQQLSNILTETGQYYRSVYGNLGSPSVIEEICSISKVAAAKRRIANCRIGVVGYPHIKGQTQAAFDEIELHQRLGARIVSVSMHQYATTVASIKDDEVTPNWNRISDGWVASPSIKNRSMKALRIILL